MNTATGPLHRVIYEAHKARILLSGPVTDATIFDLCEEIELAAGYYKYEEIELLIDSPGGHLSYLEYFLARLRLWRRDPNFHLSTLALTQAMSAAGVILALGDIGYRRAYPCARILLHDVRITAEGMEMDKGRLSKLHSVLEVTDRQLLSEIAAHIYAGKVLTEKDVGTRGEEVFRHREIPMADARGKIKRMHAHGLHLEERDILRSLERLQSLDMPITPQFAVESLIIDRIEGDTAKTMKR